MSNTSETTCNGLQEEWYTIQLECVQNLYEFILRRTATILKAIDGSTLY
jgi:hypothetical protein